MVIKPNTNWKLLQQYLEWETLMYNGHPAKYGIEADEFAVYLWKGKRYVAFYKNGDLGGAKGIYMDEFYEENFRNRYHLFQFIQDYLG